MSRARSSQSFSAEFLLIHGVSGTRWLDNPKIHNLIKSACNPVAPQCPIGRWMQDHS